MNTLLTAGQKTCQGLSCENEIEPLKWSFRAIWELNCSGCCGCLECERWTPTLKNKLPGSRCMHSWGGLGAPVLGTLAFPVHSFVCLLSQVAPLFLACMLPSFLPSLDTQGSFSCSDSS